MSSAPHFLMCPPRRLRDRIRNQSLDEPRGRHRLQPSALNANGGPCMTPWSSWEPPSNDSRPCPVCPTSCSPPMQDSSIIAYSSARSSDTESAGETPISISRRASTDSRWSPSPGFYFRDGRCPLPGDILFGGYRFRSDAKSHLWIGHQLKVEALPLELVDPRFYHLDTCFCPIDLESAIYYPGAFRRLWTFGTSTTGSPT